MCKNSKLLNKIFYESALICIEWTALMSLFTFEVCDVKHEGRRKKKIQSSSKVHNLDSKGLPEKENENSLVIANQNILQQKCSAPLMCIRIYFKIPLVGEQFQISNGMEKCLKSMLIA